MINESTHLDQHCVRQKCEKSELQSWTKKVLSEHNVLPNYKIISTNNLSN